MPDKKIIAVSGASGFVGAALVSVLGEAGYRVRRMVRAKPGDSSNAIYWNPEEDKIDAAEFEGVFAVIHLAAENIASGRWSKAQKERIRTSRVEGTQLIAQALADCQNGPRVFIATSAIGYYGNRGEELLTETATAGEDFLADVCQAWEAAAAPAREAGLRVVHPRIGVVLGTEGGALKKMLLPFKLGLGGVIGNGKQWMSWIERSDLVRAILFLMENECLSGPVNLVAPNPVTNREFTKTLGTVLRRPTMFPMPAFAARLAFGEMADALLLSSTRVSSARLSEAGFTFNYSELKPALAHLLSK